MGVVAVALATMSGSAVRAQSAAVSPTDKEKALAYLESTKKGVLEATKGLSEAQWNFKPGPERWSVAEVMEHIATSEDFLRGLGEKQVKDVPVGTPLPEADQKKDDEMLLKGMPDRTQKHQAPEPLKPTNKYGSGEAARKHFIESRATTVAFLKDTPDLRGHLADSQMGMKMDGYEWVLAVAGHSERHTKQILEVKADPNFPKN
jgi:hypothetical protein